MNKVGTKWDKHIDNRSERIENVDIHMSEYCSPFLALSRDPIERKKENLKRFPTKNLSPFSVPLPIDWKGKDLVVRI